MNKKTIGIGLFLATMAPFLTANLTIIVNPALASISALYPEIPFATFTWVSTIASLFGIAGSLGAGMLAGKRMSVKAALIIALLFTGVGGILPIFITSFPLLLVCRAFVGCGVGMVSSIGYPMILSVFEGPQAMRMTGMGTSVMNVSGVVYQILAGFLAAVSLDAIWLLNLVPLILLLFVMKNIKTDNPPAVEEKTVQKERRPFPRKPIFCMIVFAIMTAAGYPLLLNMSAIVLSENLGTPSLTGVLSSLFSVGGILAGILFPFVSKQLKRAVVPAACLCEAAGVLTAFFFHHAAGMGLGLILMGIGNYTVWPGLVADFHTYVPEEHMTMASGLAAVGINAGMFLGSPFILAAAAISQSDSLRLPLLYGGIGIGLCTLVWLVIIGKEQTTNG